MNNPQPIDKFTKADYDFIEVFRKVTNPTIPQCDMVLKLYNKYVGKMVGYSIDCNCSRSIWNIWAGLNDWVGKNHNLFEK